MSFDMGFNFRSTSGFVTDQAYAVPVLGEAYPHTYTNGNGLSINAGWTPTGPTGQIDTSNTNDPRIAGFNYKFTGIRTNFQVDLSSGSAPGAGTYSVDFADGRADTSQPHDGFKILDNTTLLIDGTNAGSGYAIAANHYIDATLTDVAATTTWTGTPSTQTFATTTANVLALPDDSFFQTVVAHFRLTLAGGTSTDITPDTGSASLVGYQPTLIGQMTITTVFSNLGDQGFIAFQAQAINKVEASLDGVTYHDITALGRAVTGAILFSDVAFFFYRVTSVGAIVYTTGADKATIN